ncbi:MAG: hypothetical protein WC607_00355 [Candidatus Micrarchaeia archaeon]
MVEGLDDAITLGFGLIAVLMSALFYLQTHKTHAEYDDRFKDYGKRADDFDERTTKIRKRSKQIMILQSAKAGVREAEKLFSRATSRALAKVSMKVRNIRRNRK